MQPELPTEQELFHAALELATAQRAAYLVKACAGDPALRARVEALLAVQASADALFDPAGQETLVGGPGSGRTGTIRLTSPNEKPGDTIGRYKLLQNIGEGGCGSVYMAEQSEPVRRKVALKVIKLGMDTKSVIARFDAERQALAMMDHPNIAKVLDAGTTNAGRPYFVMELVRGIPITKYCDENHLDTPARLGLFTAVCSAIQHAHQKGIIHRDIKPSNILVTLHDGVPVPKVIDFGIAKATKARLTDLTLFTELHAFIGTPAYMSPEQAEMSGLDIDTRADIYSLGVLLYELLSGKLPFDPQALLKSGLDGMRRTIREVEPPRPSTRLLDVVAADVRRLQSTPPPTSGAEEETRASSRRLLQRQEELASLLRGELDWIVMKALEKDRTRRYESASAFAQDIKRYLGNEAVLACPPSAAYVFQKLVRRHRLAFAAGTAVAASLVIGLSVSTWLFFKEKAAAERAVKAEQQAKADAIRARDAEMLAKTRLSEVAAERDAKELARKDAEAISKFLGEVFQTPDPARNSRIITVAEMLDTAAKKLDTDLATQPKQRAKLQATLGNTYRALGLPRQAIPLVEMARDYHLAASGPEDPATLDAMENVAISYRDAGRQDEALKLREEVLALRRKVSGPEHPDTLSAMSSLAVSYSDAGSRDEALKLEEEVLPLSRKVNGPEHPNTLRAMNNLAVSYHAAGRRDEAFKLREEVLTLRRKVSGPEHPETLRAMNNLASSYADAGRRDEALKLREEVLTLSRKVNGPEHPATLVTMADLANSYSDAGRRDEALKLREEVLALRRKVSGPEHPDTLLAMNNLANSYRAKGEVARAEALEKEIAAAKAKAKPAAQPTAK